MSERLVAANELGEAGIVLTKVISRFVGNRRIAERRFEEGGFVDVKSLEKEPIAALVLSGSLRVGRPYELQVK